MLNCSAIVGRLVSDPELKSTSNGTAVCSFTVAVDRNYDRTQADFIDCVAWRQQAEFVSKHFFKGPWIAVNGSIQTRNFEDKSGNKRKSTEIVADEVNFCGDRPKEAPVDDDPFGDIL